MLSDIEIFVKIKICNLDVTGTIVRSKFCWFCTCSIKHKLFSSPPICNESGKIFLLNWCKYEHI